jgi:hypothetical protein
MFRAMNLVLALVVCTIGWSTAQAQDTPESVKPPQQNGKLRLAKPLEYDYRAFPSDVGPDALGVHRRLQPNYMVPQQKAVSYIEEALLLH